VGRKNSGKTLLIEKLVQRLAADGYRVGTIKHTHHHHELDTPGKDSHRHRQAGAAVVGILSPSMSAVFRPSDARDSTNRDRYAELAPLAADCDIVLVEGDLHAAAPKVEVWRREISESPLASEDNSILAVISDSDYDVRQPIWHRSNIAEIAHKLLELADSVVPKSSS